MADKNFKLSGETKSLITSLGKRDNVFKKLMIQAESNYQKHKNRKTRRTE